MKFSKSLITLSIFASFSGAVTAQQTINGYPVPANATTGNARAVVGVAPLSTEGLAPFVSPLIPSATPFDRSWTTYFVGQTRYNRDGNPVTIRADGSLAYGDGSVVVPPPAGRDRTTVYTAYFGGGGTGTPTCTTASLIAAPVFTSSDNAQGAKPSNWSFIRSDSTAPGFCPGNGPD
jgi:hypothetical protein